MAEEWLHTSSSKQNTDIWQKLCQQSRFTVLIVWQDLSLHLSAAALATPATEGVSSATSTSGMKRKPSSSSVFSIRSKKDRQDKFQSTTPKWVYGSKPLNVNSERNQTLHQFILEVTVLDLKHFSAVNKPGLLYPHADHGIKETWSYVWQHPNAKKGPATATLIQTMLLLASPAGVHLTMNTLRSALVTLMIWSGCLWVRLYTPSEDYYIASNNMKEGAVPSEWLEFTIQHQAVSKAVKPTWWRLLINLRAPFNMLAPSASIGN